MKNVLRTKYKNVVLTVRKGDITKMHTEAIVNPANSYGTMGGGVALAIKEMGGIEIEKEALQYAPIPIGEAVVTTAGKLNAQMVIHAPTMKEPIEPCTSHRVRKATEAALRCAEKQNVEKIAFPGMGTGYGGLPKQKAAQVIVNMIISHINKGTKLKEIVLVGLHDDLVKEFIKVIRHSIIS